jgi:hypothetical protein
MKTTLLVGVILFSFVSTIVAQKKSTLWAIVIGEVAGVDQAAEVDYEMTHSDASFWSERDRWPVS